MKIILLGYRGSGKSTVGQHVAKKLGWAFVDTDEVIVERFGGMSIAKIWSEYGERAFREKEVEVVKEACDGKGDAVIALGGGAVMQKGAFDAVVGCCDAVRVYLSAPAEVLYERISGDVKSDETRPSLTGKGTGLDEVREILAKRVETYQAASDVIVDVAAPELEQVSDEIIGLIGQQ
ncbi:shikimate kinase [Poriferisphaera corsica]|nr:shikimate kinase [Poriferisphaera corsica]